MRLKLKLSRSLVFTILFSFILLSNPVCSQTLLSDNDIKIIGFDTDVDSCDTKQLSLKVNKSITQNTEFSILNSGYGILGNDSWDYESESMSGMRVKYNGSDTIQIGDVWCIFFFCEDTDPPDGGGTGTDDESFEKGYQNIEIKINGIDKTNDFETTDINGGSDHDLFGLDNNKNIFITQGTFKDYYGKSILNGNILDKLITTRNDIQQFSVVDFGNDNDIPIDIPGEGDSYTGYILCGEITCDGNNLTGGGNPQDQWVVQNTRDAQDALNLEQICNDICGEGPNCEEDLQVEITQTKICDYYTCIPRGSSANYLLDFFVNEQSIINDPLFDGDICLNSNCGSQGSACSPGDLCANPTYLPQQIMAWLDQSGYTYDDCYITTSHPTISCYDNSYYILVIENTSAEFDYLSTTGGDLEFYTNNSDCDLVLEVEATCLIDSIRWFNGETGVPSITIPYDPYNGDDLSVYISCTNGCSIDTTIIVENNQAFTKQSTYTRSKVSNGLYVYPNPSTGILNIQLPQLESESVLNIMDSTGKLIEQKYIAPGDTSYSLDYQNKQPGMYFIHIRSNEISFSTKFILNK